LANTYRSISKGALQLNLLLVLEALRATGNELSSKTAADLLQVSFPTLPERFRGRGFKTVAIQELLDEQILRLEKLAPRLMKSQSALRWEHCANAE